MWRAKSDGVDGGAGAGDVMGLLLRERIVFLGNEIEDFLADAVVSQLLLLDAIDSESDIRLFVNSPGGSLRSNLSSKTQDKISVTIHTTPQILDYIRACNKKDCRCASHNHVHLQALHWSCTAI
jgi:hypothetical protein